MNQPKLAFDDDPVWNALFAGSQDMLMAMAEEALEDARAGLTVSLDPELISTISVPSVFDTFPPTDIDDLSFRIGLRAAQAATCPHCGQSLAGLGGTYAHPAPATYDASGDRGVVPGANVTNEPPPPSGYMSRDKLL